MKRLILASLVAFSPVFAVNADTLTVDITANVVAAAAESPVCSVVAPNNVNFGNISAFDADISSFVSVNVACTIAANVSVSLTGVANSSDPSSVVAVLQDGSGDAIEVTSDFVTSSENLAGVSSAETVDMLVEIDPTTLVGLTAGNFAGLINMEIAY